MVQASLPPYTQALPAMPDQLMLQATVKGLKMCFAQDLADSGTMTENVAAGCMADGGACGNLPGLNHAC